MPGFVGLGKTMKTVVVTGSTRGIGLGLADAFLARGCQVMVSGRNPVTVNEVVESLASKHGADRVGGQPCDISSYTQVQALWEAAIQRFGKVDIWINNAGAANTLTPFWELEPDQMRGVVDTNVLGTMFGCKVALQGMSQQGYGAIYNMEGYGSRGGRKIAGLTLYGTTKAALAFLDDALAEEIKGKPVILGFLSPGMVVTDLLLNQRNGDPADWERSKRAFNILADRVETVTPWLADQVLANTQNGRRISWINGMKIMARFLTAPFTKRKVID